MKRWVTILSGLLLALSMGLGAAWADEAIPLAKVTVDLWPEYDRPAMLVILHIQLPPEVSLPSQVKIRIPASAGEPNAVAVVGEGGQLLVAHYQRIVEGDWAVLDITANTPGLQVEYYDPLEKDGAQRRYVYRWPGDHAVQDLVLHIQQPLGAQDFTLTPAAGTPSREEDGLFYYTTDLGAVQAGETFTLEVRYTKRDDTLTMQQLQAQPTAPIAEAKGQVTFSDWLPWLLGGLGLALIVGGLVWYWRSGQVVAEPASRRPRHPAKAKRTRSEVEPVRYCPQCGARVQPGDRFCRNCGAPLR